MDQCDGTGVTCSEIDANALAFPVAVARGLRAARPTDLSRFGAVGPARLRRRALRRPLILVGRLSPGRFRTCAAGLGLVSLVDLGHGPNMARAGLDAKA